MNFFYLKIWTEFDKDKSGYIESDELRKFIIKVLQSKKIDVDQISDEKINEYTETIVKIFKYYILL